MLGWLVSNLVSGKNVTRPKPICRQWTQQALIFIAAYLGLDLYSGGGASAIGPLQAMAMSNCVGTTPSNTAPRFVWGAAP